MRQLQQLDEHIWTIPAPLSLLGLKINTRTTIVQSARDQSLWVHSPCELSPELEGEVRALGEVAHIVAPNLFHHLYFKRWAEAWPYAARWAPEGLAQKRTDLPSMSSLERLRGAPQAEGWPAELQAHPLEGLPKSREWAFYHEPSQSLILTDLLFYFPHARGLMGLYARLNRCVERPNQTVIFKRLVKDREAFKCSLEPILSLSSRRLSLCHHEIFEGDPARCQELIREAISWLN